MTFFLVGLLCFVGGLISGSLVTWAYGIIEASKGDEL